MPFSAVMEVHGAITDQVAVMSSPEAAVLSGAHHGREEGQGTEEGCKEVTEMPDLSSQLGEDEQEGWERKQQCQGLETFDSQGITKSKLEKRAVMDRREDGWRPHFSAGTDHSRWLWAGWPRSSGRTLAGDEKVKGAESSLLDA